MYKISVKQVHQLAASRKPGFIEEVHQNANSKNGFLYIDNDTLRRLKRKYDTSEHVDVVGAVKKTFSALKSVAKTEILRRDRVTETEYEERLSICKNCPLAKLKKNGSLHTCGPMIESLLKKGEKTCGCILTKKARDTQQSCPQNKWPTIV